MMTALGVVAAAVMVTSYALESRDRRWIAVFAVFAVACVATSVYAIGTGSWLFAILEFIWAGIALQRFLSTNSVTLPERRTFSSG
jgi:hypothetical protein